MAYDIVSIMKAIRDNATAEYTTRVPEATKTNFTEVGNVITSYTTTANEFIGALVNRIAMVVISNKMINNPMAVLKKGGVPLGQDIQEVFTNPSVAETYTLTSTDLLTNKAPDVKSIYYRLNRKDKYSVTVTREMLSLAFTNEAQMSQLIDSIISSLYSGDNFDEFIMMKNLMKKAVDSDHITKVIVYDENTETLSDEVTSRELVKQVKRFSNLMTFPSSLYNKYASITSDAKPVITWTPMEDQILILDSVVASNIDVEVLARAFNMDKANIQTRTLNIDNFGGADVLALLCDKSFFQVYDNMKEMSSFSNPDNLTNKYFLHHWQTYGYSIFANAVAFMYTPSTES